MSTWPSHMRRMPLHIETSISYEMAFFYSIPAFDYSTRRPKKKKKVNHSIGGVRGATGGGGQPRDNHGTTRGTTTGQPTGQQRDNHGTTAGQPRARIGQRDATRRDATRRDATRRHTEPRRALASRADPRPRSFASPRFARTHERNETISRLGHKGLTPPTSDIRNRSIVENPTCSIHRWF